MKCSLKTRRAAVVVVAGVGLAQVAACSSRWDPTNYYEPYDDSYVPPEPVQVIDVSAVPPPPISGGTLLVTADKTIAVAADPDRDRIAVVNLEGVPYATSIALEPGDEPGRVVEGAPGAAYVALRRGGAVVRVDLATHSIARMPVCPAPRGLAYDAAADLLHVACAGGELVTLSSDPAAAPVRKLRLGVDLRDVILQGDSLLVSRFRSAELLVVKADGSVSHSVRPPSYHQTSSNRSFEPGVAWKTVALPGGGAAMVHQRALSTPLDMEAPVTPAYYSGYDCTTTVVHGAVTTMRPLASDGTPNPDPPKPGVGGIGLTVLPVDIAVSSDGKRVAVAAAGSSLVLESPISTLEATDALDTCVNSPEQRAVPVFGEPIAVAYDGEENLIVQVREPAALDIYGALSGMLITTIWLEGDSRVDTGHRLFHGDPDAFIAPMIACASCHPEGGDDGHVWVFNPLGKRRTQGLAGGVLETLPLHWDGGMEDLGAIMESVFMGRMGGTFQGPKRIEAFGNWINTIPAVPASEPVDEEAVVRGKGLFNDPTVGCATCHSGPMLTNNLSTDVGTGGKLQVPSLRGISLRAPFMHDGCAPTLHDRFGACGGGDKHGVTSGLTPAQIDDLVAYLMTL